MGNLVLKGHISYATKRKYKWVAEFGKNTCEKCAALDGQEFDEDEVPYWPHPNCRCRVEEISVVDEIESELNEYREEIEQLKLQANELLGDANVLREQIETLQREAKRNVASPLDSQLTRIEYEIYKLIDKISSLTIDEITTRVLNNIQKQIEEIKQNLSKLYKNIKPIAIKYAPKPIFDKGVQIYGKYQNQPDAAALWEISTSKFSSQLAKEYIKQNGSVLENVSDIHNRNLELVIQSKLLKQIGQTNTKGIVFHQHSSISNAIIKDEAFKKFIKSCKNELIKNRQVENKSISFRQGNLLNAYHYADIINIHIDKENNLNALVFDTYDFNEGETDILVSIPRELQKNGEITPYYSVIKIEVPEAIWTKY